MKDVKLWVVRAGQAGVHFDVFAEKQLVAIGMSEELGADALQLERSALSAAVAKQHPSWPDGRVRTLAGQLYRFVHEVEVGERVATYDPNGRRYLIGTVASQARYQPDTFEKSCRTSATCDGTVTSCGTLSLSPLATRSGRSRRCSSCG